MLDEYHQKADDAFDGTDQALHGTRAALKGIKAPIPLPEVKVEYQRGERLYAEADGATLLEVAPDGAARAPDVRDIELIHFGTVYRDKGSTFAHPTVDDRDPEAFDALPRGRAIAFRAALQREAVLLAMSIKATADAFEEDDAGKGALGTTLAAVQDLVGGARGTQAAVSAADLNAFAGRARAIGRSLDDRSIRYPALHKAGRELHELRGQLRKHLASQAETLKMSGGPLPDGVLTSLPIIGEVLKGAGIGEYVTWGYTIPMVAFDVYLATLLDLELRLGPVVDTACRDLSIDAIRGRQAPPYAVWVNPEQVTPSPLLGIPANPTGTPLDSAAGGALSPVRDAATAVNSAVDFLSVPAAPTPGSPYLDRALGMPAPPPNVPVGGSPRVDPRWPDELGQVIVGKFNDRMGSFMPDWLQSVVVKVVGVNAEFLRATYGVLLSLEEGEGIAPGSIVTAGRNHLLDKLVEIGMSSLSVLDQFRQLSFGLPGRTLNMDAILSNALKELKKQLGFLDDVVAMAMVQVEERLVAARATALPGLTMEAYLAELPSLHARMFRNVFFPFWDLFVEAVLGPIGEALAGMLGPAGDFLMGAQSRLRQAKDMLGKAKRLIDAAFSEHELDAANAGNVGDPFVQALRSQYTDPDRLDQDLARTDKYFPFPGRTPKGIGEPITPADHDAVAPNLCWDEAVEPTPAESADATPAAGGGAP